MTLTCNKASTFTASFQWKEYTAATLDFTADGVATSFSLGSNVATDKAVVVKLNGFKFEGASVVGNTLWFPSSPICSDQIHVEFYRYTTRNLASGYTAKLQVRKTLTSDPIVSLTEVSGITLGASGSIALEIANTVTAAFTAGTYLYDLLVTQTSTGRSWRVEEGKFKVKANVTV